MNGSQLRGVLRRPFREQVAFFRAKLGDRLPTASWRDLMREQHDRAFIVAGAQSAELLADLAAAVDTAIAQGESLDAFRRRFDDIVARNGWTGWTGEGSPEGRAWRTRVIYRTNMATSYAAGRYAQLQEFPLWVYRHGGSAEPRPQHLAWNGLTLPREHPFWRTHYPPNGWGCSCYVVGAGSEEAARRLGGEPGRAPPAGWNERGRDGRLPGVDEGWDYAPGATAAEAVRALAGRTVAWPYELGKAYYDAVPEAQRDALAEAIRQQPETGKVLRRFAQRALGERGGEPIARQLAGYQTLGPLTRAEAEAAARLTGMASVGREIWDWAVSADAVRHAMGAHGDAPREALRGQIALTEGDWELLPRLLTRAAAMRDGGRSGPGRQTVAIETPLGETVYTLVFEALPRRRMMALLTMWKRRAPPLNVQDDFAV